MVYEFQYADYPLIPIKLCSSARETPVIEALLDSGGDFIVIPKPIADYLELSCLQEEVVDTANGEAPLWTALVTMVVKTDDGKEFTYEDIEIHVSNRDDIPVLIGRNPVFDDHEIIFRKREGKLILSPVEIW